MSDEDNDQSPEELEAQQQTDEDNAFLNTLPSSPHALYQRPDFAQKLIKYHFRPMGPYTGNNYFSMRQEGTGANAECATYYTG